MRLLALPFPQRRVVAWVGICEEYRDAAWRHPGLAGVQETLGSEVQVD